MGPVDQERVGEEKTDLRRVIVLRPESVPIGAPKGLEETPCSLKRPTVRTGPRRTVDTSLVERRESVGRERDDEDGRAQGPHVQKSRAGRGHDGSLEGARASWGLSRGGQDCTSLRTLVMLLRV